LQRFGENWTAVHCCDRARLTGQHFLLDAILYVIHILEEHKSLDIADNPWQHERSASSPEKLA
jgi:hypothetical protein